jgi:hypothetical protein
MERVKDENALSEALAISLGASAEFKKRFLRKAGAEGNGIKIETRKPDIKSRKIPDLTISGGSKLLLFEIKERARLHPDQWNNYRKIAEGSGHDPDKSVFAIVAPWANTDDRIKPQGNIFRWTDIYEIASEASKVESDEVGKFLLQEFTTFLAGRDMKPFDGFAQQDIDTINRIPAVGKKLRNFLQDVFNELSQHQNKSVVIQKGTVEVKTYKDYPEVYVWVNFNVRSKLVRSKTLTVWVGIQEYQTKGPVLGLGVWVTNRMRKKWEKKLRRLGFTWDETGEGGFVKSLKTELKSSGNDPHLLGGLVQEVQEIMAKVYDRL